MKLLFVLVGAIAVAVATTPLGGSRDRSWIVVNVAELPEGEAAQRNARRHAQYHCSTYGQDARLTGMRGRSYYFHCVRRKKNRLFSVRLEEV